MAFIEFSETAGVTVIGPRVPATLAAKAATPLSQLEWRVVELARNDGLVSLRPQRKRSWLSRFVLGPNPPSPMLADEKLEALRKLAVLAWHHGYTLPSSAMKQAVSAGYSEWQVGQVIDAIVGERPAFRRVNG
jgi:hypothetical protein